MADDKLAARYRALATEEPSAVLDDAIRAAARRGISAGPMRARPSRWAVPASIAAVLLLSVGVTMRMQEEQPGIETAEAPRVAPPKAAVELAMRKDVAPEPTPPPASVSPPAPASAPAPAMKVAPKPSPPPAERVAAPQAQAVQTAPTVQAFSPPVAQAAPKPSPAPALRAASPPAGAAMDANVARGEAFADKEKRAKTEEAVVVETPERKLEKIIELRRAGRHAEADEAVARFRREHPDYRIPEATWERIRPP